MPEFFSRLQLAWFRRQLRGQRGNFYHELSMSLRDHVPVVTTLRKYEARARMHGSALSRVYLEMLIGLQNGSLSVALSKIASPLEQTLIDATQTAGDDTMAQGFQYMAQTVEKVEKMRAALLKALAYPAFLLVLFTGMLVTFSSYAVPVLVELLPPQKWPPLGKVLYATADAVTKYGLYAFAAVAVLVIAFLASLNRWTGPLRQKLDTCFPYNIYRDFSGALLLMSLAAMMNAGISLRTSLGRAQKFAAPWMGWHIRKILLNLSKPTSPYFGQAFRTGVLNVHMADRVQDASERRNPIEAFIRTGSQAIDQMVIILERRAKVINVVVLLFCGIFLGLMFAGFMSTAMSMQSGMREGR